MLSYTWANLDQIRIELETTLTLFATFDTHWAHAFRTPKSKSLHISQMRSYTHTSFLPPSLSFPLFLSSNNYEHHLQKLKSIFLAFTQSTWAPTKLIPVLLYYAYHTPVLPKPSLIVL